MMKIVILIYQIIQEKFAYGELFMLVMIGYIFMFKMVKKNAEFRFRNSSWVNTSLNTDQVHVVGQLQYTNREYPLH